MRLRKGDTVTESMLNEFFLDLYNRFCEKFLIDAEKISVFSGMYPRKSIKKAWLNVLFNQFHDILDGSGTSEAYLYPKKLAEEALELGKKILKSGLKKLAEEIDFSKPGIPIVVFNPLSWNRLDIVKVKVPKHLIPDNPMISTSDDNKKIIAQVNGEEIIFVAEIPSVGYRTFYLIEGKKK